MAPFQVWLVSLLGQESPIATFMRTAWGWPMMESLHFMSLSLLVGPIAVFDLRLLGVGSRMPMAAARRLVNWGLAGFALSILTGLTFLLTEPDQYIYNPAFHLKVLFIAIAGANAGLFAILPFGRQLARHRGFAATAGKLPNRAVPVSARVIAAISLTLWVSVIVAGRLITFYRPGDCRPGETPLILTCIP
jgi:hypothetical protein